MGGLLGANLVAGRFVEHQEQTSQQSEPPPHPAGPPPAEHAAAVVRLEKSEKGKKLAHRSLDFFLGGELKSQKHFW